MKKQLPVLLATLIALLGAASLGHTAATTITLDDYRGGISPKWKEKKFNGRTRYEATTKDGVPCIMARSSASASGLVYEIGYDPKSLPILHWTWQIEDVIVTADATRKSGDDYPARVYVVFPSVLFWRTKALNYIWDNRHPRGSFIPNAYTANAMMIVVESGGAKKGQWIEETRNIRDDFIKAFGEEPPDAGAIAIMTDTDDTGASARAWYGPIRIEAAAP